jgi:hypothetical protein
MTKYERIAHQIVLVQRYYHSYGWIGALYCCIKANGSGRFLLALEDCQLEFMVHSWIL